MKDAKIPPSLRNIFKEIENDTGVKNICGSLTNWAEQGVLLLNAVLTVRQGQIGSHRGRDGRLYDKVIELLNQEKTQLFLCYGEMMLRRRWI